MKFRVISRINPLKKDDAPKYYASAVNSGVVDLYDFADDIAGRSSLTRGDVENVLSQLLDRLPYYLKDGKTVALFRFGKVRLTLSSVGSETPEEFHASMVKGARVIFTPDARLKKELSNIHLERTDK